MLNIKDILTESINRNASDLHLLAGYYPTIRINTKLFSLKTTEMISPEISEHLIQSILSPEQKEDFVTNKEVDISYELGKTRFRVNCYYEKGAMAASFRLIPSTIKTIEQLNLPSQFHNFAQYQDGLVLITGPTGEGKSTTLAAIVNEINTNDTRHIITIEDPIEYIYPKARSIVSQRELHIDTYSWTKALGGVLREDPDVVLIGEMRDFDTIQAALTIAETGHLVFSTLHTSTTPEAINRIIDVFPAHQQKQIRYQLASTLRAVVSQRLLPNVDMTSRVPAIELLLNIPAVSSIIREGNVFMLDNVIETGEENKMILFEKYLLKLYTQGLISREIAIQYAERPREIMKFIK